jgi:thiol-disulfide isomerase/thioredoxin
MMGATMILAAVLATGAAAEGEELPRYRLEPGMLLTYKGSGRSNYTQMTSAEESETKAWVVGRNPDGSVRVVMRQGSRYASARDGEALDLAKEPMDYDFGRIDLFPDGRLGPSAEIGYRIRPRTIFPRLPEDRAQAEAGWFVADEGSLDGVRYEAPRAEPGGWLIRAASEGPESRVYESTGGFTFHFDAGRGLVERVESEHTQGYGFQGKGTGTVELASLETLDEGKLAAFRQAADAYFDAEKSSTAAWDEHDPAKLEAALASAKAELVRSRDAMSEPTFREALDRRIERFDSSAGYTLEEAKRRAEVVGKPAPGWKAPGLDGKEHDLADYRGKVVVLDFWYRGCGWCIRAMPQMNEVAEHFAGKSVAVLGMNTDRNEADAKLVADVMGLKYGTVRIDHDLPEKYGVRGFPTVVVIDPEGVVRDLHVGYSRDLRESLTKSIEALLPK